MRRAVSSIGAWLVATSLAIVVAWLGVRSVQFAAVGDRTEPLSAAEARKLAPRAAATTAPTHAARDTATAFPAPSRSTTPSRSTAATVPPAVAGDWQQVPDGRGGIALRRTFRVAGGAATIQFTGRTVRVTAAAPSPGFEVTFDQRSAGVVHVTFTSPKHFSRIEASWQDGMRVRTTEGDV